MGKSTKSVRVPHEQRLRREVLVGARELALLHLRRALGHEEGLAHGRVVRRLGPGGGDAARLGLSAAEAIMLVTSLMPDSRAAIFDELRSAGAARSGEALVGGGVWCVALRESGLVFPRWRAASTWCVCVGRPGTGAIVACVCLVGAAEVFVGSARSPERGAQTMNRRVAPDSCAGSGAASVRLAPPSHVRPRDDATDATAAQRNRWFRASPILRWRGFCGPPVSSASAGQ